jgi:trigger factor
VSEVAINIEEISMIKKKLSFDIPWNEVKEALDAVYRDIGKKAKIKGFRPGKVPRNVLESNFKDHAEEETITNIINKYYWQALDDKGIMALSKPDITQEGFKDNTNFTFTASFETEPDFEPKGYNGIEVEKENIQITESDLNNRLNEIRQMFATMEVVKDDRAAIMGDYVTIDFAGTLDSVSHDDLKADNYFLELGSKRFIPGFEEQIPGMKKGETLDIKVKFPEDYHEEKFAGKDVIFTVTIKDIKEKKLPEIDENFIKNFDKYNSLDELKNDARKALEQDCERITETNLQNKIMEIILKENDFEAPPSLVEKQIFHMMADTQKRMTSAGMDETSAMELSFKMHDKFKEEAEKIVKSFLLLKKIAQKEEIGVEEADLDKHIKELSEKYGRDYEQIRTAFEKEERKDNLRTELIQKKTFDFIEQKANIKIIEKIGMAVEGK